MSTRSHLIGVRKLLPLASFINLMQRLFPFHWRHQLFGQLILYVLVLHVPLAVYIRVDGDLGPPYLYLSEDVSQRLDRRLHQCGVKSPANWQ